MDFKQFTIKSQEAVQKAQELATVAQNQAIETGHLLKGLMLTDESVISFLFNKLNVNSSRVNQSLDAILQSYPKVSGAEVYLGRQAQSALMNAQSYLKTFNDEFVSVDHILLALLNNKDSVSTLLKDAGITENGLKKAINELRGGQRITSDTAEQQHQSLDKYAKNLNELASRGKLDPVIGRDEEIRRVLQILSRRTKNNPVLIGEPGVGKTAIAEGLAHRIVSGDVPENLKSKRIYSLDMGALIAGAKYKGEFEERLKSVVKEVINSDGEI
ncbi:MAG: AAA family ATPase, partial [Bacteroidota bacterium]|nr:AAA family ATPase [Bacteroidota bacterium]MDX5431174.1 AAA family ATPase [Bacteroidota bacterium]MDX5469913.1 AAA family ATPase [Bacteroidota bacterium]